MNPDNEHDGDVLNLDDEVIEQEVGDQTADTDGDTEGTDAEPEVIGFEDEIDNEPAPTDLVKHLRKENRELHKRIAAARREPEQQAVIEVGEKPTMETCDWDEDRFSAEFEAWQDRKRQAEDKERQREEAQTAQAKQWQAVTENYNTRKAALPYADKEEAEEAAFAVLGDVARAVVAKVADDPARMIYALGRSPAKLAELAKITDPLELTKAIVKMEAKVTTKTGKRPPNPDTPIKGGVVTASRVDKEEERLEKEADRTGDRSKLIAYRRSKREK